MLDISDSLEKDSLTKDVREMNDFLRKRNRIGEFLKLGEPSLPQTLFAIALDWGLVFAFTSLVYFHSLLWLPAALIVIGSRQRALVVLTHDASHYLLAKNRHINDLVANLFLCFPMLKSLKYYRTTHLPHHINLGDEQNDTDRLHDPEAAKKGWLHVYLKYLLSYDLWVVPELARMFSKISKRHMLYLTIWWGGVLSGLSIIAGTGYAATFCVLWFCARAVAYHAITTFIIISDHHGLFPGSILGYTRNHPSKGFLRWFIHPHNNGLHLIHHLAPFVPFYNLNKARALLKGWNRFDRAEQCETYFLGKKSVVRSWGRCTAPFTLANTKPAFDALEAVMRENPAPSFERAKNNLSQGIADAA